MMNLISRFKSLPVKNRNLLGIGIVLGLVVALPLFIWAIVTQNFNPNQKAASGEPGVCLLQNNVVEVTPNSDVNGTCHDIQTAVNAAVDGSTVLIRPGTYNVATTINVANKNNITITGDSQSGSNAAQIIFNSDGWGFKVASSSGSIEWLTATGNTPNGLLRIENSSNFAVGYASLYATSSHTMDVYDSGKISIFNTEFQSSAGALEISGSNNMNIMNNRFHNSENAIAINDVDGIKIQSNLIYGNRESGIAASNLNNSSITFNTLINNSYINTNAGTVYLFGAQGTNNIFSNNIVTGSAGIGINAESNQTFATFTLNDVYANTPNYQNYQNLTGLYANISSDPNLNSTLDLYCPDLGSPVIYGDPTKSEYMGYFAGYCGGATPTPVPTATPAQTPTPSPTIGPNTYNNPNSCNGTCGSNANCQANYMCYNGYCRNPSCPTDLTCGCNVTPTPTAISSSKGNSPSPTPEITYYNNQTPIAGASGQLGSPTSSPKPTPILSIKAPAIGSVNGVNLKYIAIGVFAVIALFFGLSVLFGSIGGGKKIPEIKYQEPVVPQNNQPETPSIPEEPVSPPTPPTDLPQNPV